MTVLHIFLGLSLMLGMDINWTGLTLSNLFIIKINSCTNIGLYKRNSLATPQSSRSQSPFLSAHSFSSFQNSVVSHIPVIRHCVDFLLFHFPCAHLSSNCYGHLFMSTNLILLNILFLNAKYEYNFVNLPFYLIVCFFNVVLPWFSWRLCHEKKGLI